MGQLWEGLDVRNQLGEGGAHGCLSCDDVSVGLGAQIAISAPHIVLLIGSERNHRETFIKCDE